MSYDVFISFKNLVNNKPSTDSRVARRLNDELEKKGFSVFFSEEEIRNSNDEHWKKQIDESLHSSRLMVLVASTLDSNSIFAEWVRYEWDYFVKHNKPIVMVKVGNGFRDENFKRLELCDYVKILKLASESDSDFTKVVRSIIQYL